MLSQALFTHHAINKNKVASVNKHRIKKACKWDRAKSCRDATEIKRGIRFMLQHVYHRKRAPDSQWIRDWVSKIAEPNVVVKSKMSASAGNETPQLSSH
jgi:hypothetical protein